MRYEIKTIQNREEIEKCPMFQVDHFQWRCVCKPKTYGRLGYLPEEGLFLQMFCEEPAPYRTCTKLNSPVYFDSAMEAFFCFYPPEEGEMDYMNFEFNANGALLVQHGMKRTERTFIPVRDVASCHCQAQLHENGWEAQLLIPHSLIERVYKRHGFAPGQIIFCNFYKLSETPTIEHYGSTFPIESDMPTFHLSKFFGEAVFS